MKIKPFIILAVSLLAIALIVVLVITSGGKKQSSVQESESSNPAEQAVAQPLSNENEAGNNLDPIQPQNPARLDKEMVAQVNNFRITEKNAKNKAFFYYSLLAIECVLPDFY